MSIHDFQPTLGRLLKISYIGRLVFSLCCVERLLPSFERYAKNAGLDEEVFALHAAVDAAWNYAETQNIDINSLTKLEQGCLLPSEDDAWRNAEPYAEDAVAVVIFVLHMLRDKDGGVVESKNISARLYEAVDNFVSNAIDKKRFPDEEVIQKHPLMQREFARQDADLREIETSHADQLDVRFLNTKRHEAKQQAASVFVV